jgi:bacterial/archaeal transporter family-2 protein
VDKSVVAGLATVMAGGLVALQAPINSVLGKSVGSFAAASVNFVVGLAVLALITLVFAAGFGDLGEGRGLAWYYWVGGGVVGAAYVATVLITVRELGAGGVTAATITGQLAASIALDRAGVLGLPETPITASRVVGVALLVAGTILVIR